MTDAQTRANIIRGSKLERPLSGVVEEKSSSEVENVNDMFPWGDGVDTAETHSSIAPTDGIQDTVAKKVQRKGAEVPTEYFKQKSFFSGPLLPSEVCFLSIIFSSCLVIACSSCQLCDYTNIWFNYIGKYSNKCTL